jgi:hypothetical protein
MKRVLLALLVVALASTGAVALATSAPPKPKPPRVPQPPRPVSTPMPGCTTKPPPPSVSSAPASQAMLDTIGVLRRPATPEDRPLESALKDVFFMEGLKLDAARQATAGTWLLPIENVRPFIPISERCLRNYTKQQQQQIREEERKARERGPVEGLAIVRAQQLGERYDLDAIKQSKAFSSEICAGPMHDKIGFHGIVPDGVSKVTLAARDGGMTETTPANNLFAIEIPRPDSASGIPAHVTFSTPGGPVDVALPPGNDRAFTQPCEPPSRAGRGNRREPPTPIDHPAGAKIELTTSRWEAEDTGPLLAGATYRANGRRCLLIAPEKTLKAGGKAHRFCVSEATVRKRAYVAHATRLANGDVILEGFADRDQISYMLLERAIVPGGRVLWTAKDSGAFFFAVRGRHKRAGSFDLRAARRGAPVRYFDRRIIHLARE